MTTEPEVPEVQSGPSVVRTAVAVGLLLAALAVLVAMDAPSWMKSILAFALLSILVLKTWKVR